ncbi:hypothetical protein SCAR479_02377 [Seiridium cardinale]|uniref:Uncharacterized protein n=1 Tax=Seiridium cardinale TaxID=138064 RepID=A0ABR2X5S9_9PEZI
MALGRQPIPRFTPLKPLKPLITKFHRSREHTMDHDQVSSHIRLSDRGGYIARYDPQPSRAPAPYGITRTLRPVSHDDHDLVAA